MREAIVRAVWYGEGFVAIAARALLTPLEWAYGAASFAVASQRARRATRAAVPTISVGNLTVGGTGKTPLAAWFVAQLQSRGLAPAVLMRGYGDDEPLVHERLNPGVPVLADPDRRRAAERATASGATALVLDDAFQHRQMPRDEDVVLVSADLWMNAPVRLLPAGPFREPLAALRRASLIVVTRKAASAARADEVAGILARAASGVPIAVASLALGQLNNWRTGAVESTAALAGQRILAVSGIGAPDAFLAQLAAAGASVEAATFEDHHAYTAADVSEIVGRAGRSGRVVCTLKDAVKLGALWPANAPELWYLSQVVHIERGEAAVNELLDRLASRSH